MGRNLLNVSALRDWTVIESIVHGIVVVVVVAAAAAAAALLIAERQS